MEIVVEGEFEISDEGGKGLLRSLRMFSEWLLVSSWREEGGDWGVGATIIFAAEGYGLAFYTG